MKKTYCDRCSKEVKDNKSESIMIRQLDVNEGVEDEEWELCIECFKEFRLFLRAAWKK